MVDLKKPFGSEISAGGGSSLESLKSKQDHVIIDNARRRLIGLFLMSLGGFFMTLPNTLIQLMHINSKFPISVLTILFSRSFITACASSIFIGIGQMNPVPTKKIGCTLLFLGTTCVSGILFVYSALDKIPVGDVTIILFTSPVFTGALGVAFLKQTCSVMDMLCAVCSFGGLIIMTRPTILFGAQDPESHELCECITGESDIFNTTDSEQYMFGVLFALVASFLISTYYILTQLCGKQADVMLSIFYTGIMGVIISFIMSIITGEKLFFGDRWEITAILILVGLLSFVHLLLVAEALQFEDAGPCVLVRNADSVYAFILQYTLLKVPPTLLTLLGAAVVVFSTTGLGIYRYISAKQNARTKQYE